MRPLKGEGGVTEPPAKVPAVDNNFFAVVKSTPREAVSKSNHSAKDFVHLPLNNHLDIVN